MRKWWSLTRVLVRNARAPFASGRHKKAKALLFATLVALAFFPLILQTGVFCYRLIGSLASAHLHGLVLLIGFSIVGVAVFMFGLLNVLSVFYFAEDVDILLSMPLRPSSILSSKFAAALVYDYFIVLLFLLPLLAAYGLRMRPGIAYAPMAGLIFLALPVIPLAAASIVVMAVMRFTNLMRNRDRFGKIAGTVMLVFMLALNYLLQKNAVIPDSPERISQMLASGRFMALQGLAGYLPGMSFAVKAVLFCGKPEGWGWAFLFLCVTGTAVALFLAAGERLYFRGVQTSAGRRTRSVSDSRVSIAFMRKKRPAFAAVWMKDMTILFRDSTYFMNCIVMTFLWPFLLLLMVGRGSAAISNIFLLLPVGRFTNPVLAVSLGLGMVVTALNAIASTAISREGKQLFIMKTIPVPFGVQIVAKAAAAAFMGCVTCLLFIPVAVFMFKIPVFLLGRSLILGFLGVIFSAMNGVLLDLIFPKLNWDNAYKAVKQNLNVPVHMAMNALCAAAVYMGVSRFVSGSGHGFVILFMLAAGLNMAVFLAILGFGAKMLGRIDA